MQKLSQTTKQILFKQILIKRKQNFYFLPALLLITIALLMAVSIYCYLIKYQAKQKHLLPFDTIMNWEKFYINKCIIKKSNKVKDTDKKSAHISYSIIV